MDHPHHTPTSLAKQNNILIPIAIVIAGALVAGALFMTRNGSGPATAKRPVNEYPEKNLVTVSASDHIRGSASAPIMVVEHSDTDCPYCQAFHPTLQSLVDTYGPSGKVAWVYRHFAFHTNAPKEAETTECVASLGGNDKFWQFLELLISKKNFNEQPYKGLNPAELPALAATVGVSKSAISQCLSAGTFKTKVATDYQNALKTGAKGTPYTVVVSKAEISKATRKIVEDANTQYLASSPTAPDILYVSTDKHSIVLGGAMPQDLMMRLFAELVATNK